MSWGREEWPAPTPEQCIRSCVANANEAARRQAYWESEYRSYPPGDERLPTARRNISKAVAEKAHWEQLADYHRRELSCDPPRPPVREPDDCMDEGNEEDQDPAYDGWRVG